MRHDWTLAEATELFGLPFGDLIYRAASMHRRYWKPDSVQASTLCSIKTGACPEDCAYCPQSKRYDTGLKNESLQGVDDVLEQARAALEAGATRFCMGAAWRSPKDRDIPALIDMLKGVKALGLETCMTLGMLTESQAEMLSEAGLDYYNHNLDTSEDYYDKIITTRAYQQRLDTLAHVRASGMKVCCGGILGMGESREDRLKLLLSLSNLPQHPESVPINRLVPVAGTPLADQPPIDDIEFVRSIALARIMMPKSYVRLSAGRETMSETFQALAFIAGANSIFYGEKLLTTANPQQDADRALLDKLGIDVESKIPEAAGTTR
jgi:biotin synthase